ncbi:MAG: TrmH family RNA methyltransferase, partial [Holophaga sp.]|nr:TrmH family RNA methyltransferase [Holophaga sp.]
MQTPLLLTSRANPRFRSLRDQLSANAGKRTHTLLLGEKLIEAWAEARRSLAGSRLRPTLWLRLEGAPAHFLEEEMRVDVLELGDQLMRDLADAGCAPTHALFMEIGAEPSGPLPDRVIVPWAIQDPGNLGAVLRSAAAFGFDQALLGPGCADPFSPKALRGSMGAA